MQFILQRRAAICAALALVLTWLLLVWHQPRATNDRELASGYNTTRHAYLHMVENAVTGSLFDEIGACANAECTLGALPYDASKRERGNDWPAVGHTMVGHKRLQNVKELMFDVIRKGVQGDFAELGVWRGGLCIFVKALLDTQVPKERRRVFVFDAFEALPGYGGASKYLANSETAVRHNFEKYGLLDERVIFVKGLFKDTLPNFSTMHPHARFSILRIDSNFYDSYQDCFYYLYEMLSTGGYLIMDDVR